MQQVCGGDDAWFDDPEIVPGGRFRQSPTPNYIKVSRLGERWGNEEIFSPHGGWKPYANFDEEICDFDRIPLVHLRSDLLRRRLLGRHGRQARPPRTVAWASAT
ncbi:MAG: hypothetical protein ACLUE1_04595 [Adlercreutzia equolifaciens]